MNKQITLPDGKRLQAKFLGAGSFARCYLAEDGFVYSFLKMDTQEFDYSKEGIAEWANCENSHMPEFWNLGEDDKNNRVYKSVYYGNKLTAQNKTAWKQYKELKIIWMEEVRKSNGLGSPDSVNRAIIDRAKESDIIPESLIESLTSICDALANYGDDYSLEFRPCNLKVNDAGELILLDVIFNKRALTQKINKKLYK